MNKRNAAITAFAWATAITLAIEFIPWLGHSGAIDWIYLPSILLAMILSKDAHSPGPVAGWSAFAVYTILYLVLFVIIYVALLEWRLLRKSLHHLDDAKEDLKMPQTAVPTPDKKVEVASLNLSDLMLTSPAASEKALEKIGHAIVEVEQRRQQHFLLRGTGVPNLDEPPRRVAARALAEHQNKRAVKGVLKNLHSKIAAESGRESANALIAQLTNHAVASLRPQPSGDFNSPNTGPA